MKTISATEAKRNFAAVLDDVREGPVLIRRHERDAAVVISAVEYKELRRLKVDQVMQLCREITDFATSQGMNEELLAELLADDEAA